MAMKAAAHRLRHVAQRLLAPVAVGESAAAVAQAKSKFSQAGPNSPKPSKDNQRKKPWISLDFLVRIEPFQRLAPTPGPLFSFVRARRINTVVMMNNVRASALGGRLHIRILDGARHGETVARIPIVRK